MWGLASNGGRPHVRLLRKGGFFHRKQQSLPVRKLHQAHALAEVRRLEITTMLNSLDVTPEGTPEYPIELFEDDPAKIARSMRVAMNIPPGPIYNVTEALERGGCMVVAHDFGTRQIDGFSQRPYFPPTFSVSTLNCPPTDGDGLLRMNWATS